jgi:cytosine/adenosine deaminase-related metal-dependent hydrolase
LFRGHGDGAVAPGSSFSGEDVYAATTVGLLGALEAGITTVVDWFDMPAGAHSDAALQAHADSGLRTVFVEAGSGGTGASVAPVSTHTTLAAAGDDTGVWATARDQGRRIHAHAATSPDRRGLGDMAPMLGNDVTLIHGSYFEDRDLDAVASSGAAMVVTPSSEMAGGLEPLQVQKLVDRGIRPGLGVDTERFAPGDLFAQMRAAISMQHATLFDLKLAGKAGLPKLLTTREVIRYGTIDGARAIGLGDVTGSLTPGKQADVVVLRTDRPNIYPINDPIGAVVWGMDTSNVDWVFVAGRPMMRAGILVADVAGARNLATEAHRRLTQASLSRAGEPA